MIAHEHEHRREPPAGEPIEQRMVLDNLHRLKPLLLGIVVFTAFALAGSLLLRDRAIEDFGSVRPLQQEIVLRSLWLVADVIALTMIRRLLARRPEGSTYRHVLVETGSILLNMLFVVAMLAIGYDYNPSLDVLYIALFALAPVIRLNLIKSFVVIGLPCLILLLVLLGRGIAGVVHVSNIINLVAITVLAMIVFRLMFLSRARELIQQKTIERQLAEMENLANTDALTHLANRRRLKEHLEMEWRRASRERRSLSVIMLDIDFFKRFNDVYGHLAGDGCLQAVSRIIIRHVHRAGDMAARYGGEEFAILLPDDDIKSAAAIAESIRREVYAMDRTHAGSPEHRVTVSLGVAVNRPTIASGEGLLHAADQALYQAKASGRNCVVLAEDATEGKEATSP